MRLLYVAGARPNFMKVAPLLRESERRETIHPILVHTGQHYAPNLSGVFFRDLGIRPPHHDLNVGSASQAQQTAEIMRRFEPVCEAERPDIVLVVGDVNSTMAATLVATKLGIPVAHVEAGLRSFDRSMPEEINRIVTDAVSTWLFTTEPSANENLLREGVPQDRIHFVGNVMVDTLLFFKQRAAASRILDTLGFQNGTATSNPYGVVTLHRPSNVDNLNRLAGLLGALRSIADDLPLIFPVHPRTASTLKHLGEFSGNGRLRLVEPLGYLDFLQLMTHARVIITDSGGIQEEATVLKVPCLTVRDTTERPITVACGWNRLVGTNPTALPAAYHELLARGVSGAERPALWDGQASQRILDVLLRDTASGRTDKPASTGDQQP